MIVCRLLTELVEEDKIYLVVGVLASVDHDLVTLLSKFLILHINSSLIKLSVLRIGVLL